jgi:hypothetical protein
VVSPERSSRLFQRPAAAISLINPHAAQNVFGVVSAYQIFHAKPSAPKLDDPYRPSSNPAQSVYLARRMHLLNHPFDNDVATDGHFVTRSLNLQHEYRTNSQDTGRDEH